MRSVHRTGRAEPVRESFDFPRDPVRILLFLLTVATISRVPQHFPAIAALRPALLLALGALAAALFTPRSLALKNLSSAWQPKVMMGLTFAAILSVPFGISMGGSAKYFLDEYAKVLVFAFLVMVAIRGPRDLLFFVWAYVISAGILSWFSLLVFDIKDPGTGYAQRLDELYTYDSNDVGLVLVVAIPLTLLTLQTSGTKGKLLSAFILLGIGGALARGGSRGAFLSLVIVGLVLLFVASQVSLAKRLGALAAVILALALAAPQGYWQQMQTITNVSEDFNWQKDYGRMAIWTRGLGYMWSYPVFGLGIGNFERAEGTLSEVADLAETGGGVRWTSPHNSFIEAGAELGIPGLVLFATLVFGTIVGTVRLRQRLPRSWLAGGPEERAIYLSSLYFPISMIGFAAAGSFVSFAFQDLVYLLAAYVTGLYAVAIPKLSLLNGRSSQRRRGHAVVSRSRSSGRRPLAASRSLGPPL